jgi:hypothetical protein
MELDTTKIIQKRLSNDQFIQEEHPKKQIYLHHTAGGGNPVAVANYFQQKEGKGCDGICNWRKRYNRSII